MKLKVISYGNKSIITCPFKSWPIGSRGCADCEYFRGTSNPDYVDCKKADDLIQMLSKLEYKEKIK